MKRTFDVSTKQDADSNPKVTKVTINYPEGLPSWMMDGYDAFLVVKVQNRWRSKGIPATFECNAQDLAPGQRAQALTPEQVLAALSPEERKALFDKYMGSK